MPYSRTDELPPGVRDKYSEKCQRAYMHAFNSVHEETGDEGRAAAAGHSAAQDCEAKKDMADFITTDIIPATEFRIFSGLLKASQGVDGKMRLHGVASSTTRDLHGDVMTESALEDMERAANNNLTIFLNHSYNVPEDVGGSVERAIIKTRGTDHDLNPNKDLEVDIVVNDTNPRAIETWKAIDKGTKLGLSIGAMIPEGGAKRQKNGSFIIEHVDLLETSLVGIPANPRSWVDYAAKALRLREKASTTQLGNPTLTLDGGRYKIEGSMDDLDLNLDGAETMLVGEAGRETFAILDPQPGQTIFEAIDGRINITHGNEDGSNTGYLNFDPTDPQSVASATDAFGSEIVRKATVWVETRDGDKITIGDPQAVTEGMAVNVTLAACPQCGGGRADPKAGCTSDFHQSSADPDVTDAKIRIIEVDTDDQSSGDAAQEAPSSEPGNADDTFSAPEVDVTAGTPLSLDGLTEDMLLQQSFNSLRSVALLAISELAETKRALDEEKATRIVVERERDEVVEVAAQILSRTAAIIEQVGSIPLPRKAIFKDVQDKFASIEAYYGEEFAKFLRNPAPMGR